MTNKKAPGPGDNPLSGLPPAIAAVFARGAETLRHSVLWPLNPGRPLGELAPGEELNGALSAGRLGQLLYTIRRSADALPSYELAVEGLPAGYRPDCVLLGAFALPKAQAASKQFEIPAVTPSGLDEEVASEPSYALHADDTHAPLACDGEPARNNLRAREDIEIRLDDVTLKELLVSIHARGSVTVGGVVVAEIEGFGDDGQKVSRRQLVVLPEQRKNGRLVGEATIDLQPFRPSSPATITVRTPELDLLDKDEVNEFLAEQFFLALPITDVGGRLTCSARWAPRVVADPNISWALQLAVPAEEGRS